MAKDDDATAEPEAAASTAPASAVPATPSRIVF